jgi:hypothetical protein
MASPQSKLTKQKIILELQNKISAYKIPQNITIVEKININGIGKLIMPIIA